MKTNKLCTRIAATSRHLQQQRLQQELQLVKSAKSPGSGKVNQHQQTLQPKLRPHQHHLRPHHQLHSGFIQLRPLSRQHLPCSLTTLIRTLISTPKLSPSPSLCFCLPKLRWFLLKPICSKITFKCSCNRLLFGMNLFLMHLCHSNHISRAKSTWIYRLLLATCSRR